MAADERPAQVSWTLQIQYEPRGPWSNHTSSLFSPDAAAEFMAERRATNPNRRYRLVRVTTTFVVETDPPAPRRPS